MLAAEDVVSILRQAIKGEIEVSLMYPDLSWHQVYAGDVFFRMGDAEVVIYNDCNELDYIDEVTLRNGEAGIFEDWDEPNPVDMLTHEEHEALEEILENAR